MFPRTLLGNLRDFVLLRIIRMPGVNPSFLALVTLGLLLWTRNPVSAQSSIYIDFTAAGTSVKEADKTAKVDVVLSASSSGVVTVNYTTTDHQYAKATAVLDYLPKAGTLIFPAGTLKQTIEVAIVDDTEVEPLEQFKILLSNPTGAQIGITGPEHVVFIEDNDGNGEPFPTPLTLIVAEAIHQDSPTHTDWSPADLLLWGGSIPSTADNLRVKVIENGASGDPILSYSWSLGGRGSENYPLPGNTDKWNLGDLKPVGGILLFKCVVTFQSGKTSTAERDIEVGIRTDDAILVGWIDKDGVTLPAAVDNNWVIDAFPRDGVVPTGYTLTALTTLFRSSEFYEYPQEPLGFTKNDRHYLLNWLFKYPGNPDPKEKHPDLLTDGVLDFAKVAALRADVLGYKLFNHFQVKYRVDPNGGAYDLFKGSPWRIQNDTAVGVTRDPILSWDRPGQSGPNDGALRNPNASVGLINDGSPDARGINIFSEFMGDTRHVDPGSAKFWENIGSRITFTATSTASTQIVQPYPTYYLYTNGNAFTVEAVQAKEPWDHFYVASPLGAYPFGTNPSNGIGTFFGAFGNVVPGGRNGDATTAADKTSRTPPYVAP